MSSGAPSRRNNYVREHEHVRRRRSFGSAYVSGKDAAWRPDVDLGVLPVECVGIVRARGIAPVMRRTSAPTFFFLYNKDANASSDDFFSFFMVAHPSWL